MKCSRCSVAEISPLTGACELCGFVPGTTVAVEHADALVELATKQLTHEFEFLTPIAISPYSALLRARELSSGRTLHLKILPRRADERDAEETFRATLGAFAAFDHPHIVPVLRYGSTDSVFWYAMPELSATSLRTMLRDKGTLDARTCRRVLTQVVSALEYLHRHGVVHGAIKPENVLIDRDGWVSVSDPSFQRLHQKRITLARPDDAGTTREMLLPPRPTWVAPEDHERGERSPASDQFALAALGYECLSGRPPAARPESLQRLRPDATVQTSRAIERALSEDPRQRYASCADFLWAMEASVPSADANRPADRVAQDVVLIDEWTPPADPRRYLQLGGRVAAVLGIGAVLLLAARELRSILRPEPVALRRDAPTATSSATSSATPTAAPGAAVPGRNAPAPAPAPSGAASGSSNARPTAPTSAATRPTTTPPKSAPPSSATPAVTPSAAPAPAAAPAKLFVNATPWGQLFVDGLLIGNTPRANVELTPGSHLIRVVRPGFTTFERTIRVSAGEVVRITDIVLVPAQP
jgi:serine/threonine-protein kinase